MSYSNIRRILNDLVIFRHKHGTKKPICFIDDKMKQSNLKQKTFSQILENMKHNKENQY